MEQTPKAIPTMRETARLFVRLAVIIRPYWGPLLKGMLLGLLASVLGMIAPYLSKVLVDDVYPTHNVRLLTLIVVATMILGASGAIMNAIRGVFTQVVATRLSSATVLMFFNHVQHLPLSFFEAHRVGEVMSRFQDMRNALNAVSGYVATVLTSTVYLVLIPPLLFAMDWQLACIALLTTPVTTLISAATSRFLRRYWKESAERYAEYNALQVEALANARTLKTLGAEAASFARAAQRLSEAAHVQLKANALGAAVGLLNGLVGVAGMALFTWFAWHRIVRDELTLGTFFAFSAYLGYFTRPIGALTGLVSGFQQNAVTLGRMFEYLDTAPEQEPSRLYAEQPRRPERLDLSGSIVFHDVSFAYGAARPALDGIDLELAGGETTAIVGPSGAGKSTLVRLLCRLDAPLRGTVTVGGHRIDGYPLEAWRHSLGVVWQDTTLLRGTLWENLTIAAPGATAAEIDEVVRVCQLRDLVERLPQGYETQVAEWGASLSGGQRQRFALARALLRRPSLILLDEPTANLDVSTEESLLRDLFERVRGTTVVFVTHRVATAMLASRIVVMNSGRIESVGTHRALVEESPTYRELLAASSVAADGRNLRVVRNA